MWRAVTAALRKPRGALPPILDGDSAASALIRGKTSFGAGCLLRPSRPFRFRHLTNYKLPRRNLLAHELELRLPRVVISFPTRLRHYRSLPSPHFFTDDRKPRLQEFRRPTTTFACSRAGYRVMTTTEAQGFVELRLGHEVMGGGRRRPAGICPVACSSPIRRRVERSSEEAPEECRSQTGGRAGLWRPCSLPCDWGRGWVVSPVALPRTYELKVCPAEIRAQRDWGMERAWRSGPSRALLPFAGSPRRPIPDPMSVLLSSRVPLGRGVEPVCRFGFPVPAGVEPHRTDALVVAA